ncbi:MAG: hypothetical protein ACE5OZ_18115 [Candidatus Heimdallarchaeota archaeon]
MSDLVCTACNYNEPVPSHCNKPMHIEETQGQQKLVCHMGPGCGKMDIPEHCGTPMKLVS